MNNQFFAWKDKVNAIVEARLGVGLDDLPDYDFISAYEDRATPKSAAAEFLKEVAQ